MDESPLMINSENSNSLLTSTPSAIIVVTIASTWKGDPVFARSRTSNVIAGRSDKNSTAVPRE